ncbi:hypothetical protein PR048_002285 [Dryococelus australis]|uniref:Reverse transcriptase n=1 Tax=Dryococelus australis TaxID=614101 RepID=A0ABQ9IJV7_9NEOP|nr:hypothetical protein PR048_002285 [Dryococelus australis]
MWGLRQVPAILRWNLTVLVPKGGDPMLLKNWRPVTISRLVLQELDKLVNSRLESTTIKEHRAKGSPMVLDSVHLTKDFDKVCTESIVKALHTAKNDHETIKYITAMYRDVSTILELSGRWLNSLDVKRGPLMQAMGYRDETMMGDTKVKVLAFADDVVLLKKDVATMSGPLEVLENFLETNLMECNVAKCKADQLLQVPNTRWCYVETKSQLKTQGKNVPTLEVGTQLRYLGQFYEDKGARSITHIDLT